MPPAAVLINSRRVAFSNMQPPMELGSELDSVNAMCYEYGSVILPKAGLESIRRFIVKRFVRREESTRRVAELLKAIVIH